MILEKEKSSCHILSGLNLSKEEHQEIKKLKLIIWPQIAKVIKKLKMF